jgi:type I restriction enzyme S subunit
MMKRWELPQGWGWRRLGDEEVSTVIMGQSPPSTTYNGLGEGLPFFQGKADFGEMYPNVRQWCTKPIKVSLPGDVLISVRAPVGPTNLNKEKCVIGRGLAAIRPSGRVLPKYLLFVLRAFENKITSQGSGSTFGAITKTTLEKFEVPIPYPDDPARSLAEQQRIVARLEALLGEVRALREEVQSMRRDLAQVMESAMAEVFPNPQGEVKEGWLWRRLSEISIINPRRPLIQRNDDEPTSFVPMQAVSEYEGKIYQMQIRPYG